MVSPLSEVRRHLVEREVEHALIGALAVGIHGHARATNDVDLLTTDRAVLADEFWRPLLDRGWGIEILVGEFDDPLAGSAMLTFPNTGPAIDVVVGKWRWQKEALERAEPGVLSGVELPVVRLSDLMLLKLDAGGPQDLNDASALLAVAPDPVKLRMDVEERLDRLEPPARDAWRRIAGGY